jgi:hypothetical protein
MTDDRISLRDYIDLRISQQRELTAAALESWRTRHEDLITQMSSSFEERDKRTALALTVTSDALAKADIASDKRFERIGDVAAALAGVDARIHVLEQAQYTSAGRTTGFTAGWGYLVGALGFVIAIGALLFDIFQH